VVIVDDSAMVRRMIQSYLVRQNVFEIVGTAQNGAEAVSLTPALKPDLLIMDIHMPRMDGLEATRRIKAMPHAPRVFIVSSAEAPEIRAALDAGADGFCDKQQLTDDLLPQIASCFPDQPLR
jgi:DNA-binding NarL/FixJ family response regulator